MLITFEDMPQPSQQNPPSNWPYALTGVLMACLGVIAILVLTSLRPTQDNSVLIATVIGFLSTTTGVIMTFMKAQETHLAVNSRLDAFMASARKVGHLEGEVSGRMAGIAEGELRRPLAAPAVPTTLEVDTNLTAHKIDNDATARQAPKPSPTNAAKNKDL